MEKRDNQKLILFIAILGLIVLIIVFGFIFWKPQPEIIQGEAEVTEVRISGKVPGRIERFLANEGDKVKKGDTLVILDSPEVLAKLAQANAAEAAAKAMNEKVDKGTRSEQIAMAFETWQQAVAAVDIAKKSLDRIEVLHHNEVVSTQKRDEAEANYKARRAVEKAAKAQYEMAKNGAEKEDREAVEAQLNRAKGAVSEVESYLKEIYLLSPIDGEISERYPKVGELVGTGAPIMDVMDMNDMWVSFNIREDLLRDISMGKVFKATVPALGNREIELKVSYMKDRGSYAAWRATKTTGQFDTKTFEVKAKPTNRIEGLRPGMSVLIIRK
ncbi:efflux RND transporter periplasmic adaptor subunit [Porphyromonadaceae bacterium OttesenSCG-928-L07]|nr:efflux RND transporter periplasmic adaptor subunit [Porphyromonadaceae bacterium OttesenSCG-928-L07]MDL2330982.1 efflux RND transporter periplasmic adaptor subunit [Odoribacter sp. OttesenSCG-928-A06]